MKERSYSKLNLWKWHNPNVLEFSRYDILAAAFVTWITFLAVTYGLTLFFTLVYPIALSIYLRRCLIHGIEKEKAKATGPDGRKGYADTAVLFKGFFLFAAPVGVVAILMLYADEWAMPKFAAWRSEAYASNQAL